MSTPQAPLPSETLPIGTATTVSTDGSLSMMLVEATTTINSDGTLVTAIQRQTWANRPPASATNGVFVTVDADRHTWYRPADMSEAWPSNPDHNDDQSIRFPLKMALGPVFAFIGFIFLMALYFAWRKYTQRNDAPETSQVLPTSTKKPKKALLTDEQFESLPTEVSKPKGEQHPETCVICLSDFKAGKILVTLPCSHVFHKDCVRTWLTKKSETCPLCKESVCAGLGIAEDSDGSIDIVEHVAPSEPEREPVPESHQMRNI